MPVRVGAGAGAVSPSRLFLAGAEVKRIMVGVGGSAVRAWASPLVPYSAGSTGGMDTAYDEWATMHQTVVRGNGPARISASWVYQNVAIYVGAYMTYVQIVVNGTPIQEWSHSRQAAGWTSSGSVDYVLNDGDVVVLRGKCMNTNNVHLRHITSWSFGIQPL